MNINIADLDCTLPDFDQKYSKVLNHLHYDLDQSVVKRALVEYARTIDLSDVAETIPANLIGIEGKIAYCLINGAKLKVTSTDRVKTMLSNYAKKSINDTEVEWEAIPMTLHGKNTMAYIDCYSHIDNAKAQVLSEKLSIRDLAPTVRKIVAAKSLEKSSVVKLLLDHYREALKDAKKNPVITHWVKPLAVIVDTLALLTNNRTSVRMGAKGAKARKLSNTLAQSDRKGEQAASKVTFKNEDNDLGINSVDPTNLVGAAAAVIYNTKTRRCEVYFAEDTKRLSVHGAKIVNFDVKKSTGKTIRTPETDLQHWNHAATVRRLEVLIGQINGKNWEPSGKFNRNTMILKVF